MFTVITYVGVLFWVLGITVALCSVITLKLNFKPSSKPKISGYLVTFGFYKYVRHPAYAGIILAVLGWSLWTLDWISIAWVIIVFVFLDLKSRSEEKWLEKENQGYRSYKKLVTKKFIPWLY